MCGDLAFMTRPQVKTRKTLDGIIAVSRYDCQGCSGIDGIYGHKLFHFISIVVLYDTEGINPQITVTYEFGEVHGVLNRS